MTQTPATHALQQFVAECISDGFSVGPFSGISGRNFWKCPHCEMADYDGHEQSCVIRVMAERIVELSLPRSETAAIDPSADFWHKIAKAAASSPWMPEDYCMNDWVADVVRFLSEPRAAPSTTQPTMDGVDVPHAWPEEAINGPRSEPEALVAWLATAKGIGPERTIEVMKKRLARLEEMRP